MSPRAFSLHRSSRCRFSSVVSQPRLVHAKLSSSQTLTSLRYNPLRVSIDRNDELAVAKKTKKKMSTVCYAGPYVAPLSLNNIQWISTVCSALFLQDPIVDESNCCVEIVSGSFVCSSSSRGEYGIWTAFLALLVRLFFFIPGELELPLVAILLAILAPYQVMNLRGKQEGAIMSIAIAGYMAFQHFSRIGSLKQSFDQVSIVATLAIIGITVMSCLLLF